MAVFGFEVSKLLNWDKCFWKTVTKKKFISSQTQVSQLLYFKKNKNRIKVRETFFFFFTYTKEYVKGHLPLKIAVYCQFWPTGDFSHWNSGNIRLIISITNNINILQILGYFPQVNLNKTTVEDNTDFKSGTKH